MPNTSDHALPHVSGPANSALARAGITTLEQLAGWAERDVAALHGMGPKGIRILKAALADLDLAFADPTPLPWG